MDQAAEDQKLFDAAAAWLGYASRVSETACAHGPHVLPTPEEVVAVSAVPCQANALADFALHQLLALVKMLNVDSSCKLGLSQKACATVRCPQENCYACALVIHEGGLGDFCLSSHQRLPGGNALAIYLQICRLQLETCVRA
eukprot:1158484-Pelagomonas_calceolata.AAC.14